MRNLILGLSLSVAFIVGCVVGTTRASEAVTPPAHAAPGYTGAQWQHYCYVVQGGIHRDMKTVNNILTQVGKQGFELVSATEMGLFCFKRRMR